MKNHESLEIIWNALQNGERYGYMIHTKDFSMFSAVLYLTDRNYICCHNYGSFCVKNTKTELKELIEKFFKTTPENFIEQYHIGKEYRADFYDSPDVGGKLIERTYYTADSLESARKIAEKDLVRYYERRGATLDGIAVNAVA